MVARKLSALCCLLSLFCLGACTATLTAPFSSPALPNHTDENFVDFLDVPYPASLEYNKKESFTYTRRGLLAGVVVVGGRMNIDEAGAYYDEHLPLHGWAPVAEAQSGALVSTWKKDSRILTIVARPALFSLTTELRLELWMAPPHTAADLGARVIYQKPTSGHEPPAASAGSSAEAPGASRKVKDGVAETDI